ncbi:MAG: hypothetical protein IH996_03035 [Proteobacteria bacterium]|nr:hypothetical protein [Pseudomonadota bacterium]
MEQTEFKLRLPDLELAEANVVASALKEIMEEAADDVSVVRQKDDPRTMDMGATLAIILSAPAIIEVVKGIAAYFLARPDLKSSVEFETEHGRFSFRNISPGDAREIAEMLLKK